MKAEDFYWKNKPKNSYDSGGRISMTESELWELMNGYATIQVDKGNTVKPVKACKLDAYKDGKCTLYQNKKCYKCSLLQTE